MERWTNIFQHDLPTGHVVIISAAARKTPPPIPLGSDEEGSNGGDEDDECYTGVQGSTAEDVWLDVHYGHLGI